MSDQNNTESQICRTSGKRTSLTKRAGLTMSVGRINRKLHQINKRVSPTASVATAASMQTVVTKILNLAHMQAVKEKKKRITSRHLMLGMKQDPDMEKFIRKSLIPFSGAKSHIICPHHPLQPESCTLNCGKTKKNKVKKVIRKVAKPKKVKKIVRKVKKQKKHTQKVKKTGHCGKNKK
jgi:histone H3/H4